MGASVLLIAVRRTSICVPRRFVSGWEGYQPISSTYFFGGRLAGFNNVLVADASVLPTSLGVSPQMTVMAFAHEILERHLAGGARRPR